MANGPSAPGAQATAPQVAVIVMPPVTGVPGALQGATIEVRQFVTISGAVLPDSTRFSPTIMSPTYDRALRGSVDRMRWHPAVLEGCAVPAWGMFRLTLSHLGVAGD